jgi:hypothetical protein
MEGFVLKDELSIIVGLLPKSTLRPYCSTDGRVVLVHDIVTESHSRLSNKSRP